MLSAEGRKTLLRGQQLGGGEWWFPWLRPLRKVAGATEERFRTLSKVQRQIVEAKTNVDAYTLERAQVFMNMLEQRGYGKVAKDAYGGVKFTPNKKMYNAKTTNAAKDYLEKVDDLFTQAGFAEKPKEALVLARQTQKNLLKQLSQDYPKAIGLIDTTYAYQDMLYKEMLLRHVPKVLSQYTSTSFGKMIGRNFFWGSSKADKVKALEKTLGVKLGWGERIQEAFSTANRMSYTDRVDVIKEMFGSLDKVLSKYGKEMFKTQGRRGEFLGKGLTKSGLLTPKEIATAVRPRS